MDKDLVTHYVQQLVDEANKRNEEAPDMVAQALVLMICYDSESGTKYFRSFKSNDLRIWEALGFMEFQKAQFQGETTGHWIDL